VAPKIGERIRMLRPTPIVHDGCLLADVRGLLNLRPALADYPERLAARLEANEHDVMAALEALTVDGEVLA
jgi:hypothetical protein